MKNNHATSVLAHKVRKYANQEIGFASQYTERLANGVTSFVYDRKHDVRVRMNIIKQNILAKFPKHVSIKITEPGRHPQNGIGYVRIYVSK